jgi:hypothetical protein
MSVSNVSECLKNDGRLNDQIDWPPPRISNRPAGKLKWAGDTKGGLLTDVGQVGQLPVGEKGLCRRQAPHGA